MADRCLQLKSFSERKVTVSGALLKVGESCSCSVCFHPLATWGSNETILHSQNVHFTYINGARADVCMCVYVNSQVSIQIYCTF